MKVTVKHSSPVKQTGRVMQLQSMFDVPVSKKLEKRWDVDLPIEDREWNVGLIVGPSGAGKSSVARECFGDDLVAGYNWGRGALVDDFPAHLSIGDVVAALGAVGFNTPPSWMRSFSTLSTGEQFRATCARALVDDRSLVALDEFTSVVDRQVATVASSTIAKAVRRNDRKLVAVTCHYDVEEWLQPDWVYQPGTGAFTWRSVQPRPRVDLEIYRLDRSAWKLFAPHHYLSADLSKAAQCYGAYVDGSLVGFTSYIHFPHAVARNIKMLHRTVVLPDWQGLGISTALTNTIAQQLHDQGWRVRSVTAHPAMIAARRRSPRWKLCSSANGRRQLTTTTTKKSLRARGIDPRSLVTQSFEYSAPRKS